MIEIRLSDYAQKRLNRFKYINEYDIIECVEDNISEVSFQDFLEECDTAVNSEFYDEENKITIFTTIDDNEIIIEDIRRGKPQWMV